jgi:hypothetical protein
MTVASAVVLAKVDSCQLDEIGASNPCMAPAAPQKLTAVNFAGIRRFRPPQISGLAALWSEPSETRDWKFRPPIPGMSDDAASKGDAA